MPTPQHARPVASAAVALALLAAPVAVGIPAIALTGEVPAQDSSTAQTEPQLSPTHDADPQRTPESTPEGTDEPTPSETVDPTDEPTEEPTDDPSASPTPTKDPGDDEDSGDDDGGQDNDDRDDGDRDQGGRDEGDRDGGIPDNGRGQDEDRSDRGGDRRGRIDDPSTGNGREGGRSSGPGAGSDWVPQSQGRPDYSDPVPQPPGVEGDSAITPDGAVPTADPTDGVEQEDVLANESGEASGGFPWPVIALVVVGAAAIGFVLFMARRTRP